MVDVEDFFKIKVFIHEFTRPAGLNDGAYVFTVNGPAVDDVKALHQELHFSRIVCALMMTNLHQD